jgi:hypothetical protein
LKFGFVLFLIALCALCPSALSEGSETTFGSSTADSTSLRGDIYYLPEGTSSLPDFSTLTPVGSIYTKVLDIPERSFDSGFPGVTDRFEWFAIRYTGAFRVETEGEYKFRLVSDDGSRLYIDGKKIIDNDGTHPSQSVSGSVSFNSGVHDIEVDYFQGPRYYVALQLFWTQPGGTETISNPQYIPGSSAPPTALQPDLTGVWSCDDGGTYYIRQSGDSVWWFGEPSTDPVFWSNVANGTIKGRTVSLVWSDVPKGCNLNKGTLILDIISKDSLLATEETGGFGGSTWTRIAQSECPGSATTISGSTATGPGSGATSPGSQGNLNPWEDPSIRQLIDEWILQQDKCLKNVYGSGAFVDKWGRACGDLGSTSIDCSMSPDHPADWDSYHYLWANNWCPVYYPFTLQAYVEYRQNGSSFDSLAGCKGEGESCDA